MIRAACSSSTCGALTNPLPFACPQCSHHFSHTHSSCVFCSHAPHSHAHPSHSPTLFRYAHPADPPTQHEFVGFAHYQAPEVIAGEGHSKPSDYWGLGCLVYEMATGSSPWLTGDHLKDAELAIYVRIRSHKHPKVS